jgi:rfaE bifunctional protein kinase chain/domain
MSAVHTPSQDRLLALIDAFDGQPVAMWVDLVADRFITGTPRRISREAPVLILRYEGETLAPGGGANAVANVAALGGRALPLGFVGDDAEGCGLLEIFTDRGIATDGILIREGYRTPTKTRILAGGRHAIKQQIVRYDVEDRIAPTPEEHDRLLATLASHAPNVRAVVMSDYGYGAVDPELTPRLRSVLEPGCPILGDSRYRLGELLGLDGATPNLEEAEALAGRTLEKDAELASGGHELIGRLGARFLLVTRGSAGMSLFTTEGAAHLPVHGTDQVADVTGAGDTVIGTFALALAAGASPLEAACLANYAGGVVVMKMGTATLSRDELAEAVRSDPRPLEELRWAG